MSQEIATTVVPKARVIVELQDDGTWILESYISGQRQREALTRGFETIAIRDALEAQKKRHQSRADHKAELLAQEARERHRRIWHVAAARANQGEEFANKVIGPLRPNGSPSGSVVPQATITNSTRLL